MESVHSGQSAPTKKKLRSYQQYLAAEVRDWFDNDLQSPTQLISPRLWNRNLAQNIKLLLVGTEAWQSDVRQ